MNANLYDLWRPQLITLDNATVKIMNIGLNRYAVVGSMSIQNILVCAA
jgi:hypothetical protein